MTAMDRISVNQATVETSPTEPWLDACVEAGVRLVAPWRHRYVGGDAARTRRALEERGLEVSSLCRGGFFTGTRPGKECSRDNRAAVEEAAELGAPLLVLVCGPVTGSGQHAAIDAIRRGIEELLPHATDHDVLLAVEPFHPMLAAERSAIVTLDQATRLVEDIDHPHLGLVVDSYHVWWDPDRAGAIARAGRRIAGVHLADWLVPTTSLLAGRGLPGDGVIDLARLLAELSAAGYAGPVEVEVLNEALWARPVEETVAAARDRTLALLEPEVAT